ncbi:MAG: 2-hydroxyglutaryl-CoA dehydratase [Eubacteriaceae bacterium]
MIVTFPHMGNIYIAAKILFDSLKIKYIIPPINNKKALEIGSRISPEEICLPFKIMMGNYVQSIEKGSDTILIVGSCGPCRFGEYCELQTRILQKEGYNVKFILIDYPSDAKQGDVFNRLNVITSESPLNKLQITQSILRGIKSMRLVDAIEKKAHYNSGYEVNKGESKKILNEALSETYSCENPIAAFNLLKKYKNKINNVPIDKNKNPIKIAIIGEIYTIIDPFSNLYIEEKLMNYEVSTSRILTPSWWIKDTSLKLLKLNGINTKRYSKDYLPYWIGGHGRECVSEAVMASNQDFDGAIQIFPMGCMPEIVSKSILHSISKDKNFPIMTLVVDEMTGEAGYITRIEAFLDLLERRKKHVLSRC